MFKKLSGYISRLIFPSKSVAQPWNEIVIAQNKRSTKLYVNGNLVKNKTLSLSFWSNDPGLNELAKEVENEA